MAHKLAALPQYWLGGLLWIPLGLLIFLLPASPMLFLLRAFYRDDPQEEFLPPLSRAFRRLAAVLAGVGLCAATLIGELILAVALAVVLLRIFTLRISPWLIALLAVYLEDLVILFVIGKVPFRYNLRNLTLRWLTTVMTALAFTLVVGLLTTLLAFVNGLDRLTESSGRPGNVIVLSNGAMDEAYSVLVDADVSDVEFQESVLKESDLEGWPHGKDKLDRRLCSKEVCYG